MVKMTRRKSRPQHREEVCTELQYNKMFWNSFQAEERETQRLSSPMDVSNTSPTVISMDVADDDSHPIDERLENNTLSRSFKLEEPGCRNRTSDHEISTVITDNVKQMEANPNVPFSTLPDLTETNSMSINSPAAIMHDDTPESNTNSTEPAHSEVENQPLLDTSDISLSCNNISLCHPEINTSCNSFEIVTPCDKNTTDNQVCTRLTTESVSSETNNLSSLNENSSVDKTISPPTNMPTPCRSQNVSTSTGQVLTLLKSLLTVSDNNESDSSTSNVNHVAAECTIEGNNSSPVSNTSIFNPINIKKERIDTQIDMQRPSNISLNINVSSAEVCHDNGCYLPNEVTNEGFPTCIVPQLDHMDEVTTNSDYLTIGNKNIHLSQPIVSDNNMSTIKNNEKPNICVFPVSNSFLASRIKIEPSQMNNSLQLMKKELSALYDNLIKQGVFNMKMDVESEHSADEASSTNSLLTNISCRVRVDRLPSPLMKEDSVVLSDEIFKTWKNRIVKQRNNDKFKHLKVWRRGRKLLWRECELAGMDRATYNKQIAYINKHKLNDSSSSDSEAHEKNIENKTTTPEEDICADTQSINKLTCKKKKKGSKLKNYKNSTSENPSLEEYVVERNDSDHQSSGDKNTAALKITIRKTSVSKSEDEKDKSVDSEPENDSAVQHNKKTKRSLTTKKTFQKPERSPGKQTSQKTISSEANKIHKNYTIEEEDEEQSLLGRRSYEVENFNLLEKWEIPFEEPTLFRSPRVASRLAQLKNKEAFKSTITRPKVQKTVTFCKEVKDVMEMLCTKTIEAILSPDTTSSVDKLDEKNSTKSSDIDSEVEPHGNHHTQTSDGSIKDISEDGTDKDIDCSVGDSSSIEDSPQKLNTNVVALPRKSKRKRMFGSKKRKYRGKLNNSTTRPHVDDSITSSSTHSPLYSTQVPVVSEGLGQDSTETDSVISSGEQVSNKEQEISLPLQNTTEENNEEEEIIPQRITRAKRSATNMDFVQLEVFTIPRKPRSSLPKTANKISSEIPSNEIDPVVPKQQKIGKTSSCNKIDSTLTAELEPISNPLFNDLSTQVHEVSEGLGDIEKEIPSESNGPGNNQELTPEEPNQIPDSPMSPTPESVENEPITLRRTRYQKSKASIGGSAYIGLKKPPENSEQLTSSTIDNELSLEKQIEDHNIHEPTLNIDKMETSEVNDTNSANLFNSEVASSVSSVDNSSVIPVVVEAQSDNELTSSQVLLTDAQAARIPTELSNDAVDSSKITSDAVMNDEESISSSVCESVEQVKAEQRNEDHQERSPIVESTSVSEPAAEVEKAKQINEVRQERSPTVESTIVSESVEQEKVQQINEVHQEKSPIIGRLAVLDTLNSILATNTQCKLPTNAINSCVEKANLKQKIAKSDNDDLDRDIGDLVVDEAFSEDESTGQDLALRINKIIQEQLKDDEPQNTIEGKTNLKQSSPSSVSTTVTGLDVDECNSKDKESSASSKSSDKDNVNADSSNGQSSGKRRTSIDERTGLPTTLIQRLRDPRIRTKLLSHLEKDEISATNTQVASPQPGCSVVDGQVETKSNETPVGLGRDPRTHRSSIRDTPIASNSISSLPGAVRPGTSVQCGSIIADRNDVSHTSSETTSRICKVPVLPTPIDSTTSSGTPSRVCKVPLLPTPTDAIPIRNLAQQKYGSSETSWGCKVPLLPTPSESTPIRNAAQRAYASSETPARGCTMPLLPTPTESTPMRNTAQQKYVSSDTPSRGCKVPLLPTPPESTWNTTQLRNATESHENCKSGEFSDDDEDECVKRRQKKSKKEVDVELMYKSPLEDLQSESRQSYRRNDRQFTAKSSRLRNKTRPYRSQWDQKPSHNVFPQHPNQPPRHQGNTVQYPAYCEAPSWDWEGNMQSSDVPSVRTEYMEMHIHNLERVPRTIDTSDQPICRVYSELNTNNPSILGMPPLAYDLKQEVTTISMVDEMGVAVDILQYPKPTSCLTDDYFAKLPCDFYLDAVISDPSISFSCVMDEEVEVTDNEISDIFYDSDDKCSGNDKFDTEPPIVTENLGVNSKNTNETVQVGQEVTTNKEHISQETCPVTEEIKVREEIETNPLMSLLNNLPMLKERYSFKTDNVSSGPKPQDPPSVPKQQEVFSVPDDKSPSIIPLLFTTPPSNIIPPVNIISSPVTVPPSNKKEFQPIEVPHPPKLSIDDYIQAKSKSLDTSKLAPKYDKVREKSKEKSPFKSSKKPLLSRSKSKSPLRKQIKRRRSRSGSPYMRKNRRSRSITRSPPSPPSSLPWNSTQRYNSKSPRRSLSKRRDRSSSKRRYRSRSKSLIRSRSRSKSFVRSRSRSFVRGRSRSRSFVRSRSRSRSFVRGRSRSRSFIRSRSRSRGFRKSRSRSGSRGRHSRQVWRDSKGVLRKSRSSSPERTKSKLRKNKSPRKSTNLRKSPIQPWNPFI